MTKDKLEQLNKLIVELHNEHNCVYIELVD